MPVRAMAPVHLYWSTILIACTQLADAVAHTAGYDDSAETVAEVM